MQQALWVSNKMQQALWFSNKYSKRCDFQTKCNKRCDFQTNTASVVIFKQNAASVVFFNQFHWSVRKVRDKFQWIVLYSKMWKMSIVYPFFYRVKIIGYYSDISTNDSILPGVVAEILRFYSKCFFQGAVRLRVFTMCTSIGGTPPHLSSYFSGKGLAFVHFLYLWFTLVYLSCLYLVIWKLYFSVIFQSCHCSSGHLMKSSKY